MNYLHNMKLFSLSKRYTINVAKDIDYKPICKISSLFFMKFKLRNEYLFISRSIRPYSKLLFIRPTDSNVTDYHTNRFSNVNFKGSVMKFENVYCSCAATRNQFYHKENYQSSHIHLNQENKKEFTMTMPTLQNNIKETKIKVMEKLIIERENIYTIPNLLCVSRIVLSPFLSYAVVTSHYSTALGIFVFAGVTDLLDGMIARTFPSQASKLGSFLDPLADKILVASLFLSLTYIGSIPLQLTSLIIYRDFVIIGGASYIRYKSIPHPVTIARYFDATHATVQLAPTLISKINTGVQLCLIVSSLSAAVFDCLDHHLLPVLWSITGTTTVISGLSYIFCDDTYKFIKQSEDLLKQKKL